MSERAKQRIAMGVAKTEGYPLISERAECVATQFCASIGETAITTHSRDHISVRTAQVDGEGIATRGMSISAFPRNRSAGQ